MPIFDRSIADRLIDEVSTEILKFKLKPCLATALVGEDPASEIYVNNKQRSCKRVGISTVSLKLATDVSEQELLDHIDRWNKDVNIHGILVQLPLPKHINTSNIINAISPKKDVDGFHPMNMGGIVNKTALFLPCTPSGVMHLLKYTGVNLTGKKIVIINNTVVLGIPLALMLNNENATITMCNVYTPDVKLYTKEADIVISAVGQRPKFSITADHIKSGAIVIDVGMNKVNGRLCGDVDFEEVKSKASWVTPVPGCVGPSTIAYLLKNTIKAFHENRR